MNFDARSLRRASLTAGIALALIIVLALFGAFGAVGRLVTPGDASRTAQDILSSEGLFRWGVASLILVVILDVIVAAALLTVFQPVSRTLSAMAALFRAVYAAVYLVAVSQLVVALGLLGDPDQALRAVNAYDTIWHVGLNLFGVHLLLIGLLAYRSGFMPRIFEACSCASSALLAILTPPPLPRPPACICALTTTTSVPSSFAAW